MSDSKTITQVQNYMFCRYTARASVRLNNYSSSQKPQSELFNGCYPQDEITLRTYKLSLNCRYFRGQVMVIYN
jgi:hypothetical protein